jgi:hypothetical protein
MSKTIKAIERHMIWLGPGSTIQSTQDPERKLVAEWQRGAETFFGHVQRKLRLAFAPVQSHAPANAKC